MSDLGVSILLVFNLGISFIEFLFSRGLLFKIEKIDLDIDDFNLLWYMLRFRCV